MFARKAWINLLVLGSCFFLALGLSLLPAPLLASVSTARLESRISRVEAQNFQLRSRLNRLESQLARASRSPSSPGTPRRAPEIDLPSPPPPLGTPISDDPMFDRLATLVIELKERIQTLEKQVAELQQQ